MLSFLLGLLPTVGNIFQSAFSYLNKRADVSLEKYRVDGIYNVELMKAHVALIAAQAGVLSQVLNTKAGRGMQYLFGYPLGLWYAAVIFDSIFHRMFEYSYRVEALPEPVASWSGWIVGFLFLHSAITNWSRK